jgi:rhodanese-related sulfurtransferase
VYTQGILEMIQLCLEQDASVATNGTWSPASKQVSVFSNGSTWGDSFAEGVHAILDDQAGYWMTSGWQTEGIKLAELAVGETFGEEALIAEAKRNATVTMLSDGVLMRLNKQDFRDLMHEPLLRWVDEVQALKIIQNRGQWLDVRLPSEYQNLAIEGSINIPLYFVRLKLNALDRKMPYVVVCDTGRRSSAAAFILSERGFDAYVLKGGITTSNLPMRRPGG